MHIDTHPRHSCTANGWERCVNRTMERKLYSPMRDRNITISNIVVDRFHRRGFAFSKLECYYCVNIYAIEAIDPEIHISLPKISLGKVEGTMWLTIYILACQQCPFRSSSLKITQDSRLASSWCIDNRYQTTGQSNKILLDSPNQMQQKYLSVLSPIKWHVTPIVYHLYSLDRSNGQWATKTMQ